MPVDENGRHIIDTEQEKKAVKMAMEFKASGGWATYDWKTAAGADLEYPDLDEDDIGNLEPWIIKGETGGWIDLNTIADGDERRLAVYEKTHGIPEAFEDIDDAKELIEEIEEAEDEGEAQYKAALAKHGLIDEYHFEMVRDRVSSAEDQAWDQTQDLMDQAGAQRIAMQQAAVAADPGLMEPFEGVTIEMWAQAAAGMLANQDEASQAQMLAGLGMDRAKYDRANNEFQSRMQRDTTGAIATVYGQAFSGAQGITGGGGAGNVDGSAAQLGEEPVSFEKYGEIAGAQAAWGETGQDVTGMLQQVFGIGVSEISAYGAYWSTKFQADVKLMMKHAELMDKYKAQYMGGGGMDDDLDI
ncbi:MAG: hypothetical protein JRJ87_02540 [Deltaproteobacteria bacterium]|nr:hypothetical protein [Deltaproteobacteria bacterium]